MSKLLEGWFVPMDQIEHWDDFISERAGALYRTFPSSSKLLRLGLLCKTIVFGKMFGTCLQNCGHYELVSCSQINSKFCQQEMPEKDWHEQLLHGDTWKETDWYMVWRNFNPDILLWEKDFRLILGDNRVNTFLEFLSHNAKVSYDRYTQREKDERNLKEPKVVEYPFDGLDAMGEDPWFKHINNKIKGGEMCLNFSESLFSVC